MGPFWRLSEGESVLSLSFWWLKFLWHIWRRQWHPTPVLLPGKSHGRRSLVGCSPWGHEELDMTERFHFHFSLSCIGEGNGNPLQCSCLENPMDGGASWASIYGVAQSRTRLKRLSSSSSSVYMSISISQFIPPSPSPLGIYMLVLYIFLAISALQISQSISFFSTFEITILIILVLFFFD